MKLNKIQVTGETFRAELIGDKTYKGYRLVVHYGGDFYRVAVSVEGDTVARFYLHDDNDGEQTILSQLLIELHRWCLPTSLGDSIYAIIDPQDD